MISMLPFFMFFFVHLASASEAESIFDDYFDEELKVVEVPQDLAVRSCVRKSSILVSKLDDAYDACFGSDDEDKDSDYDWNDFEKNSNGHDSDNDGLSDDYEANEACFYEKMGWVKRRKANERAILNDFKDFKDIDLYSDFQKEIRSCASWNGDFKRKKREASWSISLSRNRREATKRAKQENLQKISKNQVRKKNDRNGGKGGKGNKKKEREINRGRKNLNSQKGRRKPGKRTKNGSDRKEKKGKKTDSEKIIKGNQNEKVKRGKSKNERKGKKMSENKLGRNKTGKSKGTKGFRNSKKKNEKKKGKKEKKSGKNKEKKSEKKKEKNNETKVKVNRKERKLMRELLPENIYNQLWCFEVTVEKALKSCVERKLMEDVEETLEVTDSTMGFTEYSTEYTYE